MFWDLPGTRRFLDDALDALRGGSSLVLCFPTDIPHEFDDALFIRVDSMLHVGRLTASDSPLADLRQQYSTDPSEVHTLADLYLDERFQGRLIRLDGLTHRNWPRWCEFLSRYAAASRSKPLLGRTLFVAPVVGAPCAYLPGNDVGLAVLDWEHALDDIDLLLFASDGLRGRSIPRLLRSLLATTIARVAAWDAETAARLLEEDPTTILDPVETLRRIAYEKGWTTETPLHWALGTQSRSGSVHPARAALDSPPEEIHHRLWDAQLGTLLPWIESLRQETVDNNIFEIKRLLRIARRSDADPYSLEIGELAELFGQGGADRNVRRDVKRLRDARNRLAHREHLAPETIFRLIDAQQP